MADLTREERRMNRRHLLDALKSETGSSGGEPAAKRVDAYRKDPLGSTTTEFGYVGGLRLTRFYVDPAKPNAGERGSLWQSLMGRMGKHGTSDPGGWDGSSDVKKLQVIAEEA